MSQSESQSMSLHSENVVLRVAFWANIMAWTVLVIYLLNFTNDIYSIITNWPINLPPAFMSQLMAYVGILSKPIFGVFYFTLARGVSQLLYLGLDIYYGKEGTEEVPESSAV